MRLEFDKSTPVWEQLLRVSDSKEPGRKHQKRKGVKAKERDKLRQKRSASLKNKKSREFHEKVAAYWRGERQTNPAA